MVSDNYKKCHGCENLLQWAPQQTNLYTQYCSDCKMCSVCGEQINSDDLAYCVKYKIQHSHLQCIAPEIRDEIENRKVTITEKHLEYLNIVRLMIEPNTELSPAANQSEAEWRTQQFITGMSLEQKFLFLKRVESIAATCSILLKKDRRNIEIEISAKEREKYLAATSKQDSASRKDQHGSNRLDASGKKSGTTGRTKLSGRDKAINALTSVGVPYEQAALAVDSQMAASGQKETVQ